MSRADRNSVFSFGEEDGPDEERTTLALPDFGAPPVSHDRADYRNVINATV